MRLLAVETSCDDTCAAVVEGACVISSVVSSQHELHSQFGGIVPEVASRRHVELIDPVIETALDRAGTALDDVEAVAVTTGPGLIGALLVGVSAAKAYASAARLPLIGVNHLDGHIASPMLEPDPLEPPYLCLVASGGHTLLVAVHEPGRHEVIGSTLDDAAGEALDKGARLLGLGFPGGPAIQREAEGGDPAAFELPVAMAAAPSLEFSFSGLKTALAYLVRDLGEDEVARRRADLAASYQAATVEQLVRKIDRALSDGCWPALALAGGVAANSLLRERAEALCADAGVRLKLVPLELCTDNAAMIGMAAQMAPAQAYPEYLDLDAFA